MVAAVTAAPKSKYLLNGWIDTESQGSACLQNIKAKKLNPNPSASQNHMTENHESEEFTCL
jgi:hypothetical protein